MTKIFQMSRLFYPTPSISHHWQRPIPRWLRSNFTSPPMPGNIPTGRCLKVFHRQQAMICSWSSQPFDPNWSRFSGWNLPAHPMAPINICVCSITLTSSGLKAMGLKVGWVVLRINWIFLLTIQRKYSILITLNIPLFWIYYCICFESL